MLCSFYSPPKSRKNQKLTDHLVTTLHMLSTMYQCLVMGAFQEGSKYLNSLLEVLADSMLRVRGLARGREGSEWERSTILSDFRQGLSQPNFPRSCKGTFPIFQVPIFQVQPIHFPIFQVELNNFPIFQIISNDFPIFRVKYFFFPAKIISYYNFSILKKRH